jgi:hypothetical protein
VVAAVCVAPTALKADSVLKNERIRRSIITFVYNNLGNEKQFGRYSNYRYLGYAEPMITGKKQGG